MGSPVKLLKCQWIPSRISAFMCLWAISIFPPSICLFCFRKYVDQSWEYINRSQTHQCGNGIEAPKFPEKEYIKGIFVAVCTVLVHPPHIFTLRMWTVHSMYWTHTLWAYIHVYMGGRAGLLTLKEMIMPVCGSLSRWRAEQITLVWIFNELAAWDQTWVAMFETFTAFLCINRRTPFRGFQRDVVYLGWPIAPS